MDKNLINKQKVITAIKPENRNKNRCFDIIPYESNRVCLSFITNGSDYINASFIDGYQKRKAYIATQTPIPQTVDAFWSMIWDQNSPIIVAFCNSSNLANPNPDQLYWPNNRSAKYQHILIEPMVEYNMPHFILREFRLIDTRDGQSRTLRQFQLQGWTNEMIVPKSAESIIDLIGQVHKTQVQFGQDGPITVHCK